jgi:hypothetical protein
VILSFKPILADKRWAKLFEKEQKIIHSKSIKVKQKQLNTQFFTTKKTNVTSLKLIQFPSEFSFKADLNNSSRLEWPSTYTCNNDK